MIIRQHPSYSHGAVFELGAVASTNTWVKDNATGCAHGDVFFTCEQTAGRGQRGNSWEALPGMNLTFSIMLRPKFIEPRSQWVISQAVALGIATVLKAVVDSDATHPHEVTIKWPNDIYVDDSKIAGILIENSINGSGIVHSIVGVGVNVNQTTFYSDAPNPISLSQITGRNYRLLHLLTKFMDSIMEYYDLVDTPEAVSLNIPYFNMLWRREGKHSFITPGGEIFMARISHIDPDGRMWLVSEDENLRGFYFKEVAFVL